MLSTSELYQSIVDAHLSGKKNNSEIARALGVSEGTVRNYLKKWTRGEPVESTRGRGQPRKITSEISSFIGKILQEDSLATARTIASKVQSSKGVTVSSSCVSKHLQKLGYRYSKPKQIPLLTKTHKQHRVEWCRRFANFDWSKVYFSDETYIALHGTSPCQWHKKGHRPTIGKPKYSPKTLFWGAISMKNRTPLVAESSTITSVRYQDMLVKHFLPFSRRTRTRSYFLQQDNAPAHVSKITKAFFKDSKIKTFDWPANSPDLNPIENLWSILKLRVFARKPKDKNDLMKIAKEEWTSISPQVVQNVIQSMPKRIRQVLDRKGEKCDY
jgi:transposase